MKVRAARRHGSLTNAQTIPLSKSTGSARTSMDQTLDMVETRDTPVARPRDHSREKKHYERPMLEGDYATVSPPPVKIQDVFSETGITNAIGITYDAIVTSEFPDCLVRETERLTGAIRDLLQDAQKNNLVGRAADHAHKVCLLPSI